MARNSSWEFFESVLETQSVVGHYRALALEDSHSYLCAGENGEPIFLVPSPDNFGYVPSIELHGMEVNFGVGCLISLNNQEALNGTFVLIRCLIKDRLAKQTFVRMLFPAVLGLGLKPSAAEIRAFVDVATDLFSDVPTDPKLIRGLWGELFVLAQANDVAKAFSFWRTIDTENFDFSCGADRLEVKTSFGDSRVHVFSLGQLRFGNNLSVIVASLILQPSVGGWDVARLVESLSSHLTSADYRKLLGSIKNTLRGSSYSETSLLFDYQKALESLRFYRSVDIPSVSYPVPPEIKNVRFSVDLSQLQTVPMNRQFGDLFSLFK